MTDRLGASMGPPPLGVPRTVAPVLVYIALNGLIQPRLVVPGLGAAGRPAALFGLGLFVWWVFARLLPADRDTVPSPIRRWGFVYLLAFVASIVAGVDRGLPGIEQRSMDRAVLVTVGLTGVVLVTQDTVRSRQDVERVLSWLVAMGGVSAAVALVQFGAGVDLTTRISIPGLVQNLDQADIATRGDVGYRRVRGMALHPIVFGVHLAMLLPLAMHLALFSETHRRLRWFLVGLLAAGIPLSISRSGILALAVSVPLYATGLTWRQRSNVVIAGVASGLMFMAVTPGLLGTIRSLFQNAASDNSVAGRTGDYGVVSEFVGDRPIFGRGPGTFIPSLYRTLDNQYLATLLEMGWVGLVALVLLMLSVLGAALRVAREAATLRDRSVGRAMGAAVAVAPVVFATVDAVAFPLFASTLVVLIGCILGTSQLLVPPPVRVASQRRVEGLEGAVGHA